MDSFPKQPSESFTIAVDFADVLGNGEALSTRTVTITKGATDVTDDIKVSDAISGTAVNVKVQAGESGHDYKIKVVVTTSQSNTFEHDILMRVREK